MLKRLLLFLFLLLFPLTTFAGTVQLPETGQTSCWDSGYNVIPCNDIFAVGQDGAEKSGAAWPSPRFVDNNDGTVTDHLTGLVWLSNAHCLETVGGIAMNSYQELTWNNALAWSNTLASGSCGLSDGSVVGDWRVPSAIELGSLLDRQATYTDWFDNQVFLNVNGYYWSSTYYPAPGTFDPERRWAFYVTHGGIMSPAPASSSNNIWPVRDGKSTSQTATVELPHPRELYDSVRGVAWPSPRFVDNGNGTITDHLTGLVWLKNANCTSLNWANALTWSKDLASGSCGLSDGSVAGDWRLPNINELRSVVNSEFIVNYADWLKSKGFANVSTKQYWSSSTNAIDPYHAWTVYMYEGSATYEGKPNNLAVWPVRGGQSSVLSVIKTGAGSGIVVPDSGELLWDGSTGKASYPEDTLVILTATPDDGSTFIGWSDGECTGTGDCTVTLDANSSVTAIFEADADGDGVADGMDLCSLDANNDADADGQCGNVDNCPFIANSDQLDIDDDGLGDACDACSADAYNDTDGDNVCGNVDNCPDMSNSDQINTDGDAQGNICDPDDDNDGVVDGSDAFPLNSSEWADSDGDGVGDNGDLCPLDAQNDVDADGVCGNVDNCPTVNNPTQSDADGDGYGDACDNLTPPGSVTVPSSDPDGNYTVTWVKSKTVGVSYVLEEATDKLFTTDVRVAYAGNGLSASIEGRSLGLTYYYRVKAVKDGFAPSTWKTARTGCFIGTKPPKGGEPKK